MPGADRHLLFGLVALQVGLIDQSQLVAAFQAWAREKGRPLSDHLVARSDLDDEQRAAVEAMVALHLREHGGDMERSLADVPAGEAIRLALALLRDPDIGATLENPPAAAPSTERDGTLDSDCTTDYAVGTTTSDGRRFRVLRPHARGALGAVFVAIDNELHREVALKQILDGHADDPIIRARFLLEAEVTGGLEHTGIVPVYGLGAYADGRPFYAMRFIRGDSLKEAIDRFHADGASKSDPGRRALELQKLLRRFLDVCNAIGYAHSRGVLHRDIKPRNIIVGKHGETLVVDWGLAKPTGRSEPGTGERTLVPDVPGGSSETLPGTAMGTPGYMSPEQARGDLDRLGPRSDVYSPGATLYCLLTGRAPFQGDDVGEVLRDVQRGAYPPPRRLDPSLDAALEAVCLKAMALEPRDRYATCRALSEDVERWLADEPVGAWREPRMRRLARWLGRHRTGVAASASALLAGLVVLGVVLAIQSAANSSLSASLKRETDAKDALAAANADLRRSKAAVQVRYELAVEAIRTFHTGASEDFLLREPAFKELRDRLLKSASDFYGKLATLLGRETDFASRRALARSNFELAILTREVGRPAAALEAQRAVLRAREALAAEPEADAETKADVGRSLTEVGTMLIVVNRMSEALEAHRRAESLLAALADADPRARAALASCRSKIGNLLFIGGRRGEALAVLQLARVDQEALAAAPGASNEDRRNLLTTLGRIAFQLYYHGRVSEAELEFRAAVGLWQKLADDNPDISEFRWDVARVHAYLGDALIETDKLEEAEAQARTALGIVQKLSDDSPGVTEYRRGLQSYHRTLAQILEEVGQPSKSESEFRMAVTIGSEFPEADPRSFAGANHLRLGLLLAQMGRPAEAEAECRTGLAIVQNLGEANPGLMTVRDKLIGALAQLGDVLRSRGQTSEAAGLYERQITLAEGSVRENPDDPGSLIDLMGGLWRRGMARRDLGDVAGAVADARRAVRLSAGLPPRRIRFRFEEACSHAALASLARLPGSGVSTAEAEAEAATAVGSLRRAVAAGYRNTNELRFESALDPLRDRHDFRLLIMDMAFPADPITR